MGCFFSLLDSNRETGTERRDSTDALINDDLRIKIDDNSFSFVSF